MSKAIKAADLFCGAGGTSTGLIEACQDIGLRCELTAVNHWQVAVANGSDANGDKRRVRSTALSQREK